MDNDLALNAKNERDFFMLKSRCVRYRNESHHPLQNAPAMEFHFAGQAPG
jgi:hypothetical protein